MLASSRQLSWCAPLRFQRPIGFLFLGGQIGQTQPQRQVRGLLQLQSRRKVVQVRGSQLRLLRLLRL